MFLYRRPIKATKQDGNLPTAGCATCASRPMFDRHRKPSPSPSRLPGPGGNRPDRPGPAVTRRRRRRDGCERTDWPRRLLDGLPSPHDLRLPPGKPEPSCDGPPCRAPARGRPASAVGSAGRVGIAGLPPNRSEHAARIVFAGKRPSRLTPAPDRGGPNRAGREADAQDWAGDVLTGELRCLAGRRPRPRHGRLRRGRLAGRRAGLFDHAGISAAGTAAVSAAARGGCVLALNRPADAGAGPGDQ